MTLCWLTQNCFFYKNSEVELYKDYASTQSFIFLSEHIAAKVDWYKVYLSLCCARGNDRRSLDNFVIDKNKKEGMYAKLESQFSDNNYLSVVIINAVSMVAYRATKQQIVDSFNMNDSISRIKMTQCNLETETAEKISSYFSKSRMIIAGFVECTLNNAGHKIFNGLSLISTLQILFLFNTNVDKTTAIALSSVIANNTNLFVVQLSNCNLQKNASIIAAALKDISTVLTLSLSQNEIPGSVADDLAIAIYVNCNLERLHLADNNLLHHAAVVASALCQIKTLVELDLSNNNMTDKVTSELALAIKSNELLQVLLIRGNSLTTDGIIKIAQSISLLSHLRILDISDNKFTKRAADAIANAISNNTGLEELHLGNNNLCTGAMKIATALTSISSLKLLDLSDNKIPTVVASKIASAIKSNCFLEELKLRDNKLMTDGIITIAQSLSNISTLRSLDIKQNKITEEAGEALSKVILSNTDIEELYLSNNSLQAGVIQLLKALKRVRLLKVLDIENNITNKVLDKATSLSYTSKFCALHYDLPLCQSEALLQSASVTSMEYCDIERKEKIASTIADVISNNTSLQSLCLRDNNLKTDEVITIVESLSNFIALNDLDLCSNQVTEEACDAIISMILRNGTLQELQLGDNDLRAGALTIVTSLQNVSSLRRLYLDNNSISNKLCAKSTSFFCNTHLELLNLSFNCLQLSGKFIAQGLSMISTLTNLNLHDCHITSKAANNLAAAIITNSLLEFLHLRNNQLQTSGVVIICQSLKYLSTLQGFDISCNEVTEHGADDIASVVLSNNKMRQLYLGGNKLDSSASIILRALQTVSSIVTLHLSYMEMTDKVVADLVEMINNNPLLEELHVAGNLLSSGLTDVIDACKRSVSKLIALDIRCNLVDPSKISDMASLISGIDTLEVLCIGGLVVSDNEKFFMNCMLKLKQINTPSREINLNKEDEILEILTSESERETIQNYIKMNYDFDYTLYNQPDPMINLFNGHLVNKYNYLNIRLQRAKQSLSQVDAASIVYFLSIISKLKVLDLEQSNIDEVAAVELGAILICNDVLEQLWLSGNQLGIIGAMFILDSLKYISSLTVLDLSFNNIGSQSAESVAEVINCNPKLEQLWLDGNGLLDVGVKQIFHALKYATDLRILSLCSNGITDDAAEELSNVIFSNNHLGDLSLGSNKLQPEGICKIVYALNYCKLSKLDLFHNKVGKNAAEKLAITISNCYTLKELYLSDSMLGTKGAVKIFESLKHKSKLQVLTLSNNNITDEAIDELCLVLAQNPRLQVLLLGRNKLQTTGVVRIAQFVKHENVIMHVLGLSGNNVDDQGKEEVYKIFTDNTLISVYM